MRLNELLTRLQALHHHDLQAVTTLTAAVAEVDHGLALLARLGHVYHLEAGPPYELDEWPRLLFHVTAAPNGRIVGSWWEARELGEGWWPTLQEAQNKEAIKAQFRGRGGVGDKSLPMLQDADIRPHYDPDAPSPPKDNGKIIKEFKDARTTNGGSSAHNGSAADADRAAAPAQPAAPDLGAGIPTKP